MNTTILENEVVSIFYQSVSTHLWHTYAVTTKKTTIWTLTALETNLYDFNLLLYIIRL